MRLVWPAYFASPDRVMPFEGMRASVAAYAGLFESLTAALPQLEGALAGVKVPLGVLAGALSPMPPDAGGGADGTSHSRRVAGRRRGRGALPVVRAAGLRARGAEAAHERAS